MKNYKNELGDIVKTLDRQISNFLGKIGKYNLDNKGVEEIIERKRKEIGNSFWEIRKTNLLITATGLGYGLFASTYSNDKLGNTITVCSLVLTWGIGIFNYKKESYRIQKYKIEILEQRQELGKILENKAEMDKLYGEIITNLEKAISLELIKLKEIGVNANGNDKKYLN